MLRDLNCIHCGKCVNECPQRASQIVNDYRKIDFAICIQCLRCVEVCSAQAIVRSGDWKNVTEIMDIVLRDDGYYQSSGGGITLSGGEPLRQWRFAKELAKAAHSRGIHVALDTCGYANWKAFSQVAEYVDLLLYDLKHLNTAMHREFTGVPNALILKNLGEVLRKTRIKVWLRIPIIPAFNNSEKAIATMGAFMQSLPRQVEKVSILPFHQYGAAKYPSLGRLYSWSDQRIETEARLQEIKRLLTTYNLNVEIGR